MIMNWMAQGYGKTVDNGMRWFRHNRLNQTEANPLKTFQGLNPDAFESRALW